MAREQAVANQQRAEKNLNVALQAFDSIFDNVSQRGVPQSLSLDLQAAATEESSSTENSETATSTTAAQPKDAAFEATLSSADAELLNSLLKFYAQFARGQCRRHQVASPHRYRLPPYRSDPSTTGQGRCSDRILQRSVKDPGTCHAQHAGDASTILAIARIYNDRGFALSTMAKPVPQIVMEHKRATRFLETQPEEISKLDDVRFELARGYDLAGSLLGRTGALSGDDMPGWGRRFGILGPGAPTDRSAVHHPDGFAGGGFHPEGLGGFGEQELAQLPVVRALDQDGNRELSGAELAKAPEALRGLDHNRDGVLDKGEVMPPPPFWDEPNQPRRDGGKWLSGGKGAIEYDLLKAAEIFGTTVDRASGTQRLLVGLCAVAASLDDAISIGRPHQRCS